MGHVPSKPVPGVPLEVIGCGLPRTGTSSFTQALEILLGSPIYHGGTQLANPNEEHMLKYMDVYRYTPIKTPDDRKAVLKALTSLTNGYRGVVDGLIGDFVGELAELYPDAAIICTTRDPGRWWQSMEPVVNSTDRRSWKQRLFCNFALALLPGLRHWNTMSDLVIAGRFSEIYSCPGEKAWHPGAYDEHLEHLSRSIPKERKVHYYSVKDGWGPLCKILNKPVPDVPFPWANSAEDTDKAVRRVFQQGFYRWAVVLGSTSIFAVIAWLIWTW